VLPHLYHTGSLAFKSRVTPLEFVMSFNSQDDHHSPGKPVKVREFKSDQGKVRENYCSCMWSIAVSIVLKGKTRDPIRLQRNVSKTAGDAI